MSAAQEQVYERRFAILTHDHPFFHWDLLLEVGDVAWTWRLLDDPGVVANPRSERIGDHRLFYLNYEGPVSGGRGVVTCWDSGTYVKKEQETEWIVVTLSGGRGQRTIRLTI